jgi:excinuclease ABC subunit A
VADIHLWGVKQNNLKNIDVKIPLGSFTVVCGPSGSGKSSLAFETLFAEGQRRFIESMSNYARQFLNKAPKPDIEGVQNIPPSISIEQKNTVKSSRSTVGTTTELVDYLRLLFEKVGVPHCPIHHIPAEKQTVTEATERIVTKFTGQRGTILVEIPEEGRLAEGKKLHSLLLQDGYLRIWVPAKKTRTTSKKAKTVEKLSEKPHEKHSEGELVEISDPAIIKKGLPSETFYLVIDRMAFNSEDRGRIADSIQQAYEASLKYNTATTTRKCSLLLSTGELIPISEEPACPECGWTPPQITSRLFSFNSPLGACPTCKGFGNILDLDENKVIPNPNLSIQQGALNPFTMPSAESDKKALFAFCKKQKISLSTPWNDLPQDQKDLVWRGNKDFFGVKGLFEYLEQIKYKMHVRVFIARYRSGSLCPMCKGSRLRPEVNHILVDGKNIHALSDMTVEALCDWFAHLKLNRQQEETVPEVLRQLRARLSFLMRVGVNYLSLNRETRTLSGGEYQRLILANQLGMGLSQSLYVLDEPTVGLHPRDNDRLISILKELKELGNTLVVVEHDHDVIQNSEHIIEMGPGSGSLGGEIVFEGDTNQFFKSSKSLTAQYVKPGHQLHPLKEARPVKIDNYKYKITLRGANGHNLKNLDVDFPLNRMVIVTGVSGSGKSTLVTKTLYPALARKLEIEFLPAQEYSEIEGVENIKNVVLIDQSPIGKSARSSPVTYMKAYDAIRTLMAATPESKSRGYTPGTFSLNVDGGRCPACKGTGFEEIDMMFMDNVIIPCDVCDGKKFRPEILEIQLYGKNINQILNMTIKEGLDFFVAHPNIRKPLSILKEVGLDYMQLGQPANSLSGGESQRLKIAKELAESNQRATLYILDEPTTGLHFREVDLLMRVLNKLIESGSSVILVEHNQDVIRQADYIIDLGPEAGHKGGSLVAQGSPEDVIKVKKSLTGQFLKRYVDN